MAIPRVSWTGRARVKASTETARMMLLTVSMIGLSFAWATEMTYGTPFLLSLGLTKSQLSTVFMAGPLSGLIVQPIIGMVSDQSTNRFGRRRPFMLGGAIAVAICLLLLGWAKEIAAFWTGSNDSELTNHYAAVIAVVDIYVLDFVINISQSTCRALVVDTLPIEKQHDGSAWVSRMGGIGQLMVYAIGALDLGSLLGNFLGDTQFKKVCFIAAIAMLSAQGATCWAVEERVQVLNSSTSNSKKTLLGVLSEIYSRLLNLPKPISAICRVQFWSWIAYYPFLFYGSTWVGEIYIRHHAPQNAGDALTEVGRAGSIAFIIFAVISFGASIILPWVIQNPEDNQEPGFTPRPPPSLEPIISAARRSKPTLRTAWMLANLLFSFTMIFAPFVESVNFATLLIASCAVPWAVAGLAPGTFLGIEVNRMSSSIPMSNIHSRRSSHGYSPADSMDLDTGAATLHLRHDSNASDMDTSTTGGLSGVYFGILNIYTTIPQFVGTAISWVVFSILEPGKSAELSDGGKMADDTTQHRGLSAIGVCLFIGALSSLVAAWSTRKLV